MHSTDQAFSTVLERLVRVVRQLATAGDLSLPAAAVLNRLVREGPQRLTSLAAGEAVSQPGMTQLVTRLERDGLVRRTASDADGRVVLVQVTSAGEEVVARRRAQRSAALRDLLRQLDPPDRAAVRTAIPALERLVDLALQPRSPASVA
jgi:DNA-binding MarR family transcriptional regulator